MKLNMIRKTIKLGKLLVIALVSSGGLAWADELSTEQMIQQLQPKKVMTRSLKPSPPSASPEDETFLRELQSTTRGIVVEEREKLANVVQKYDMPNLDLEVYFEFNSAEITSAAMPTLIKLGKTLIDPSLARQRFIISGHTDAIGADESNQKLSEARAISVKSFLIENFQIDPHRLIAVGFGEEQLKNVSDPNADENRRVTVVNVTM